MEHNGKHKSPVKGVKILQAEKKLNVLSPTKNDNSNLVINDEDTVQDSTEKLQNDPEDSKLDNGSDRSDASKHSVDNNDESSNTGCDNIEDIDLPTVVPKSNNRLNNIRVEAYTIKLLRPDLGLGEVTIKWPITILSHNKGPFTVSQEEFDDIIFGKTEKNVTARLRSATEMINLSTCKEQKLSWYKKYRSLSNYRRSINGKLVTLHAKRNSQSAAVKAILDIPENDPAKDDCKIDPRFFPF